MNDRKIKFLRAVRLLAPRDTLVLQFAECVRPDTLPERPGGAALELVASFERIRGRSSCPRRALHPFKSRAWSRPVSRCGRPPS